MSARPTLQFAPGSMVDRRYEIKRHLGDGGIGTVYLASHKVLERDVAIKFIPLIVKPGAIDPETLFQREAQVQAKLKHPNIVEALDGGILERRRENEDPIGYLVMEYVEGGSLRRKIASREIDPLFSAAVLGQVATGLTVIHAMRILHRDLKPENILVTGEMRAKVADLGNARVTGSSKYKTMNPRPIGTLHYMPFEQLMNLGMDEKVDVFALGVIAFELLAGHHPRAQSDTGLPTKQEVLGPMLARDPMPKLGPRAPNVPSAVASLIDRCLSIEPEHRPTAREMVTVLRAYVLELWEAKKRARPDAQVSAASAETDVLPESLEAAVELDRTSVTSDPHDTEVNDLPRIPPPTGRGTAPIDGAGETSVTRGPVGIPGASLELQAGPQSVGAPFSVGSLSRAAQPVAQPRTMLSPGAAADGPSEATLGPGRRPQAGTLVMEIPQAPAGPGAPAIAAAPPAAAEPHAPYVGATVRMAPATEQPLPVNLGAPNFAAGPRSIEPTSMEPRSATAPRGPLHFAEGAPPAGMDPTFAPSTRSATPSSGPGSSVAVRSNGPLLMVIAVLAICTLGLSGLIVFRKFYAPEKVTRPEVAGPVLSASPNASASASANPTTEPSSTTTESGAPTPTPSAFPSQSPVAPPQSNPKPPSGPNRTPQYSPQGL